jgi:septum formation topological specificity factor MinE
MRINLIDFMRQVSTDSKLSPKTQKDFLGVLKKFFESKDTDDIQDQKMKKLFSGKLKDKDGSSADEIISQFFNMRELSPGEIKEIEKFADNFLKKYQDEFLSVIKKEVKGIIINNKDLFIKAKAGDSKALNSISKKIESMLEKMGVKDPGNFVTDILKDTLKGVDSPF